MTPTPERRSILHGETRIEYAVVRSRKRRRTIGITVGDEGEVVVRAPLRASRAVVEDVVRRKAGWILGVTQRRRDAEADESHRFALRDTEGRVVGADEYEAQRERAQDVIGAAVRRWSGVMGCSPGPVLVRNQKRIWGSCARDGTLRFNWRLALLEPCLIDYVVVHELVHLRVRNHQREFWSAVEVVLPDFRERRKRLRGVRLG